MCVIDYTLLYVIHIFKLRDACVEYIVTSNNNHNKKYFVSFVMSNVTVENISQ